MPSPPQLVARLQRGFRRWFGGKRQTVICREGLYYLLVLAFVICGALLRDINLLMVVAGMMIGPMIYNIRAVRIALQHVTVVRKPPTGICAGDLLTVDLALTNTHARRAARMIVVEDAVEPVIGGRGQRQRPAVLFAHTAAGEKRHGFYSGRLQRRGRYRLGPLKLATRFPLGLVRRVQVVDHFDSLLVYPRLGRLTNQWARLHRDDLVGSRPRRRNQGAMEAEFFGLREWRSGDSHRTIHWRTSARRGELMVRQYEQQRNEDLLLLLDLWQPIAPSDAERERVEKAVSFAATVVVDLCRRGGGQIALGIIGEEKLFTRGMASIGLQGEMMEVLALALAGANYRLADLLPQALDEAPRGATTVVISTRPAVGADAAAVDLPAEVARRWAATPVVTIDVASPQLKEYFTWE